jgi:hypothetical protein
MAVVQYTFTHKRYTEYTERNVHNNKKKKLGKCGPCLAFVSYTLAFALQLKKKHGKTSVRAAEKCPDIPVAVVQYTFTHKQYTEQHNETEYTEWNIHNNNVTDVCTAVTEVVRMLMMTGLVMSLLLCCEKWYISL